VESVSTVRGPIPREELGATLTHEHIFIKNPELEENYPGGEWDEDAMLSLAQAGLQELHARGISTIVDLTVMGLGRSIERIQRVAEATDMNIVAATGYYTKAALPAFFHVHSPGGLVDQPDPLPGMFIEDIEHGIGGTDVKAAVIKVVTDREGLTPDVRRVLHAAAHAQIATGVPIFTHTDSGARTGLVQQEVFRELGVDLERVLIGHCDDTTDLSYLKTLMDAGSTIGMDRFGLTNVVTDDQRIDTIIELCEQGYADRMTLSHDFAYFSINIEPSIRSALWPRWRNTTVSDHVLPELRRRGTDDKTINQMMIENPARLLARRAH
jgi:phosphotriesterase-related protein